MGYAEFGGTGSVRWEIEYDNKNGSTVDKEQPGSKLKGHGVDRDPSTSVGAKVYVVCTEARVVDITGSRVTVEVTLAKKAAQVGVKWGLHVTPELEALAADTTT